jgi:ParB family chromosome partitioning protein
MGKPSAVARSISPRQRYGSPKYARPAAIPRGLNVRQTEALAKLQKSETALGIEPKTIDVKDADTRALEQELSSQLGLKVTLKNRGKGGVLAITYGSLDQLDGLLRRLR